ncbi:MAG: hypothetical protein WCR21_02675 [Bacteroidota bacterium]
MGLIAQSKKLPQPTLSDAENLAKHCVQSLINNDSLLFKSLFLLDTNANMEQSTREMIQNRMVFGNFVELKSKLMPPNGKINDMKACGILPFQYKDAKTKKKKFIYHVQTSFQVQTNTMIFLDFPCTYQNQQLRLISSVSINEVVQATD